MEYRKLGTSQLELPVITFGAWAAGGWMWGGADRKEAVKAIRAAYDEGVTAIDTAPIYGQGTSEEIVGEALDGLPRDRVQVLTKFGMRWDLKKGEFAMKSLDNAGRPIEVYKYAGKESVVFECEQSLRRLGTDHIDLLQLHWPDPTTPISGTMEALEQLVQQGKVRYAGVCNYNVEQLDEARKHVALISDQVPYSMVKRDIEEATVPYVMKHGLGILAYSPMERGLLTGKIQPDHVFAEGDHRTGLRTYRPENIRRVNAMLDELRPLAADKGITLGQLVLRWTVDRPGITVALAGARDAQQAVENARAAGVRFSAEERERIDQAVKALQLPA
ncbi:MAG TPA: aldo/keto reductase [Flavobacteriales bacterium]